MNTEQFELANKLRQQINQLTDFIGMLIDDKDIFGKIPFETRELFITELHQAVQNLEKLFESI